MRKLITCQQCGKKEWRYPTTKFCFDCKAKRDAISVKAAVKKHQQKKAAQKVPK